MTTIACADAHLTTAPADEERWGLFKFLTTEAKREKAENIILCGDGTDAKDRHTSQLVNRVADETEQVLASGVDFYWMYGNHDGLDPKNPFFRFLDKLEGFHFITKPTVVQWKIGKVLLLPNTANWEENWKGLDPYDQYDYIFAHQTFKGAISETGYLMEKGIPPTIFDAVKYKAFSGDIHVPQKFGKKGEYIGAPYRTRYGDTYEGRCLLIDNIKGKHVQKDLHYPTLGKHLVTVNNVEDLDAYRKVPEGGSVKIRVKVSRGDLPTWSETKREVMERAKKLGWEVHDVELRRTEVGGAEEGTIAIRSSVKSPTTIFKNYSKAKVLPRLVTELGTEIVDGLQRR